MTTRQIVIDQGLDFLQRVGTEQVCKVCIMNGGSCCSGCVHLADGTGCTLRNTSCTAWLCGFLGFLLYETGLYQEWTEFWRQVPGRNYRMDNTPDIFPVTKALSKRNLQFLSHELAEDLNTLSLMHPQKRYILDLREQIDNCLDELFYWKSPEKQTAIKNKLRLLSKDFSRFNQALASYREDTESSANS